MANIVYADPFGSYVRGQEQGQQRAIELATTQRAFRDSDRQAEFRKWYDPHMRDQVLRQEQQEQLQADAANLRMKISFAMTGDEAAQREVTDYISQMTGHRVNLNFNNLKPAERIWAMSVVAGHVNPIMSLKGIQSANMQGEAHKVGFPPYAPYPYGTATPGTGNTSLFEDLNFPKSEQQQSTTPGTPALTNKFRWSDDGQQQGQPTGALEEYGGSGVIEHSMPPANTGLVEPGSAGTMGEATTAGVGPEAKPGQFQPIPGYQTTSPPGSTAPGAKPPAVAKIMGSTGLPGMSVPTPAPASESTWNVPAATTSRAFYDPSTGQRVAGPEPGISYNPSTGERIGGGEAAAAATPEGEEVDALKNFRAGIPGHGYDEMRAWFEKAFGVGQPELTQNQAIARYRMPTPDTPAFAGPNVTPTVPPAQRIISNVGQNVAKAPAVVPPLRGDFSNVQQGTDYPYGPKPTFNNVVAGSSGPSYPANKFANVQSGGVTAYGGPTRMSPMTVKPPVSVPVSAKGAISRTTPPVDENRRAYEVEQKMRLGGGTY